MRTLQFKAQPTNAFFATVNQMFSGSSQLLTTAERAVMNLLCTVQTTKQCSALVLSWDEPPNIRLTAVKNAFVGRPLNLRVCMLLKSAVKKNSQKRKSSAKVKWKQSLKSGEVYFTQGSKTCHDKILGNVKEHWMWKQPVKILTGELYQLTWSICQPEFQSAMFTPQMSPSNNRNSWKFKQIFGVKHRN